MSKYEDGSSIEFLGMIQDLIRRVEKLESGARIGNTAIDLGSLWVKNGSFKVGDPAKIYFGPVLFGTDTTPGWIFYRADETPVFALAGSSADDQFWLFRDNVGNIVISDDGQTNQGLARPYIPIAFSEHYNFAFNINTTSATFTGLWAAQYVKQHPRIRVKALVKTSDGTTGGEIRLFNITTGEDITGAVNIPLGQFGIINLGPTQITGDHMSLIEVEVQVRRTAGAGNIGVKIYGATGEQS